LCIRVIKYTLTSTYNPFLSHEPTITIL
jgi:hypothetical protein